MKQAFFSIIRKGYQSNSDYFFLAFTRVFNNSVAPKLTTAPRNARITVFTKSSELTFGKILNNVPAAVPAFKEMLVPIARVIFSSLEQFCRIFHSNLAYCR